MRLRPEWAPNHVANAIYLTRLGFYDGLVFHRVIPGFMAQAGDPLGTGQGGPGYRLDGEFPKDRKARHRARGVLSAANAGPGTDGSQFFILFKAQPSLNGDHTVYGELVEGKPALREIEKLGTRKGEPKREIAIYTAAIEVK